MLKVSTDSVLMK